MYANLASDNFFLMLNNTDKPAEILNNADSGNVAPEIHCKDSPDSNIMI